jgi:hypothetical protein
MKAAKKATKKTAKAAKSDSSAANDLGTCIIWGGNVAGRIVMTNVNEQGCVATAALAHAHHQFVKHK